ncbi:helix-turn-helix transcriptional regulator [Nocardia sp. NPDC005745]|uniref:helix-turn-helix domain-containing protein n=1 Tax=Nocardia sp. NPDC005745 TaxID=3157061 RepID=UPI0033D9F38B
MDEGTDTGLAADRAAEGAALRALSRRVEDGDTARAERAELIRRLYRTGWTQEALARECGIKQQTVSRIVSSGSPPPV